MVFSTCCKADVMVFGYKSAAMDVCKACNLPCKTFCILALADVIQYCNDPATDENGGAK